MEGAALIRPACGAGRHAAHLARRHGAVVDAVDASPSQIERARARATCERSPAGIERAERLPPTPARAAWTVALLHAARAAKE
ncbi:class I SAM-dependent methyltransferase [Streptomyces chiangmaiensis]|uniref:Class I SAM-dependent methyltransferase n=1 Tax=Streptomyces chiangmaiensis TaxID=766497 RepID=A0ABU7FPS0_9ACTN|nr:class I SAM-dependent methyltransferase [Streptomyces chiangmaiensis]MED7825099.1 class I SAM-dependent methyltransferase [Streptomyces chiangmaiensis]